LISVRKISHPRASVYVISAIPRFEPGLAVSGSTADAQTSARIAKSVKINTGVKELNKLFKDKMPAEYRVTFVDFASQLLFPNGTIDGSFYRSRASASLSYKGQQLLYKTLTTQIFANMTKLKRPLPDPVVHLHLQSKAKGTANQYLD
jgi:hypothetical protein